MKHLVSMISGQGKTKEQLAQEVWAAFQKFQKVSKESKAKLEIHSMPTYNKKDNAI